MEIVINQKLIQKVEQNGRITFPVDLRERFAIGKGDYVEVTVNKIIRYEEVHA
jgi:AbrB family looped-hinge helix DNA binding protein